MKFTYVIDGSEINDKESFYDEFYMNMTDDLEFEPAHNLSAFTDVLRGGFGMHEYGDAISVLWENFAHSRKALGDEFTLKVLTIILREDDEYSCILKIEE